MSIEHSSLRTREVLSFKRLIIDPALIEAHDFGSNTGSFFVSSEQANGTGKMSLTESLRVTDRRGNLAFIDENRHIPFKTKRVYYLHDTLGGKTRLGPRTQLQKFFIAASGSFDVILDDKFHRKRYHFNGSYYGLSAPTMAWRERDSFSSGSVCFVLTSEYDERKCTRDYAVFEESMAGGSSYGAK